MAIPKFHNERLSNLPERYFTALGHLQYAYSMVEVQITCVINLLVLDGYDPKEHRFLFGRVHAVLGGMRMDTAKDTLRRILRVAEAPPALIKYTGIIFAQLSEIQYFRNRLTHYRTSNWTRKRNHFINTDLDTAREQEKAVTIAFGYDALDAARHDLHAISLYLDQSMPDDGEIHLEPPAWQYKPSMLIR